MKTWTGLLAIVLVAAVCRAQEFSLQDEKGKTAGPFVLKDGTEISVGSAKAVITKVRTEKQQILDDMREIMIPQIEFKQATIREAVTTLQQAAAKYDTKKRNINIVLGFTAEQEQAHTNTVITIKATNISLLDALRTATDVANVKYIIRGGVVTVMPVDAPEDELFIRTFMILSTLCERFNKLGNEMLDEDRRNQNASWKELFAALGVSWPAGSSIKYLETIGKLRVCNTKENLDKLGQVLRELNCTPRQIQMDVQFVAFDLTNIAHIAATGKINTATLTALWTNGCGELLAAPTVVTKSGAEVMVKGVTEVIYPTRFDSSSDAQTSSSNASPANAQSDILPGGWETRETGTIFQVVPEVSAEGQMINLTINPQLVEDPVWHDFGPVALDKNGKEKPTQMQQPFFHVLSTSTSVSVVSGHRVLVSGGMPSRDHKRVVYLFVTATLVDTQGNTLEPPADADVPYNPHASSIAP